MTVVSIGESLEFLRSQTGFAMQGLIAFAAGAASAWVVIRGHIEFLERFPLWVFKWVTKLIGQTPRMVRLFVVIFGFNSVAMFAYMCTGVWVVMPSVVCFLTGMNLAIIVVRSQPAPVAVEDMDEETLARRAAELETGPQLKVFPLLCGLLVVLLELPAFWYSIGMGISLGHFMREHLSLGQILTFRYESTGVGQAFALRAVAYVQIIVPVLAISALAEAYAVREAGKLVSVGPPKDDAPPPS